MCTRLVYLGPENIVLTGRSMDWHGEIGTNIWAFPRGMERTGEVGPSSISWTAEYGSVVASAYDIATTDGMNEAGLVANVLWLTESDYPEWNGDRPGLSISLWAQYVLDNFATVAEAVENHRNKEFVVVSDEIPDEGRLATLHLSISDVTGDSAILEYVDGELTIHHGRKYQVMTNSPSFDQQLALDEYWSEIGGTVMLPGTNRPADRFARASFYVDAIPQTQNRRTATASVFGAIRNVSVPYGISTPDAPHISSTRWRTVADHRDRRYYFESALSPNVFWLDLDGIDFEADAEVRSLSLGENQANVFAGDVADELVETEPFEFLGVPARSG
ncbi:Choloylglycine hydrolase [Haloterrigena turkmenica DSM 5511]|uniref:Choloylglycine hydrolase n=1 Tax=Haloterrigena turkmenica (strain ATCC 51198 / DSM 5511 / JCM 9101 / NCIMB 13204 / VKM B-1734 / 4k) TaxID=543526 RepID=D2RZ16_HALTV|nr:linear amide C-N hydrolase [Haloterrigena turkmenica]ADB61984.1 Choloylglycine hydrolase [Haloterrigena turkmenica DSM 5511]